MERFAQPVSRLSFLRHSIPERSSRDRSLAHTSSVSRTPAAAAGCRVQLAAAAPTFKKNYYANPVAIKEKITAATSAKILGKRGLQRRVPTPSGYARRGRRQESNKQEKAAACWRECNLL
jgi:hypothetical protein